MKKIFSLLIAFFICASMLSVCGVNAAEEPIDIETRASHIHNWDDGTVTIKPTLYQNGEMKIICISCGMSLTMSLNKLNYDINNDSKINAADLICVQQKLLNVGYNNTYIDINGDIIFDVKDFISLKKYIANADNNQNPGKDDSNETEGF